jgi:hypothetical protein
MDSFHIAALFTALVRSMVALLGHLPAGRKLRMRMQQRKAENERAALLNSRVDAFLDAQMSSDFEEPGRYNIRMQISSPIDELGPKR